MARRRIGKAIGARTARKLIRELGGAPAPDLLADLERLVPGFRALSSEVVCLNDGQVVHLFLESANLFPSADAFRQLMEDVHRRASQPAGHPLGTAFPNGAGFIAAVPALVGELPGKLGIPADALDGSVDGLEKLDRAARRLGGQECLDNPTILAPLVAYVGEVIRNAAGGDWQIDANSGREWEPVIAGPEGTRFHPFTIFKPLLEGESMYVAVDFEVTRRHARTTPPRKRAGLFASHEQRIAPAVGPLALVSEDAYRVTKLYGDGRPWRVSFTRDVDVDDFPCKGGTEALFKRNGEFFSGVLSRPHSFGALQFPAGTLVEFYNGRRDGRVQWVTLGADQDIQGVPCKAGTLTQFCFHKRQPYLVTGTLAADHDFNGVRQLAGTEFSIDRKQHLER